MDIGANPSAEGGEQEVVDDQAVKVVDIVDTFRLQEQAPFDKKTFGAYIKRYVKNVTQNLPEDRREEFIKNVEGAVKWLLSMLNDFQFFVGQSMREDGALVFAYYKEGSNNPTFVYFRDGLKEVKC